MPYAGCDVSGELQAPGFPPPRHEGLEPRLVNGHHAGIQALDLAVVDVDANYLIARLGEAGSRHEPNVPRSEYGQFHRRKVYTIARERWVLDFKVLRRPLVDL
jgi:hypothetical protein